MENHQVHARLLAESHTGSAISSLLLVLIAFVLLLEESRAMASRSEPMIDANPELQSYYHSLESRIGYDVVLGGARHFGYWEKDTYWPFPLGRAVRASELTVLFPFERPSAQVSFSSAPSGLLERRSPRSRARFPLLVGHTDTRETAVEEKLGDTLALPSGARLLDAGCGVGNLAIHLARSRGHRVLGIDVVDYHLTTARRNIARAGLPANQVEVAKMDYHHLESLDAGVFDGIYTLETLVHATDLPAVLRGFHRLLRQGGRVVFFEYDHDFVRDLEEAGDTAAKKQHRSRPKVFKDMLEEAGFADVVVQDYTDNIRPMTRLFFLFAYIPWLIVSLLGLERYFINTVAVIDGYRNHDHRRYLAIAATKPGAASVKS